MNRLRDVQKIYLNPSTLLAATRPVELVTVLGSCVAIVFFHRERGIGAMSHSLLPKGNDPAPKYVDSSFWLMVDWFLENAISPNQIEARVYGGSSMFPTEENGGAHPSVGEQNIEVAMALIRSLNLNYQGGDVGGAMGRKVVFNTRTGEVVVKRLDHKTSEAEKEAFSGNIPFDLYYQR